MLLEQINQDLKNAMKNKEKDKLETIRLLKTSLMNEKIKLGVSELSNDDELTVISREVKQRKDSINEYEKVGRFELAEKERTQLDIIETYLPKQLSNDEIMNIIVSVCKEEHVSSMKDMGKVMSVLKKHVNGRADMSIVSKMVKEILSK